MSKPLMKCPRCGKECLHGTGKCIPCIIYEFYEEADIDGLTDFVVGMLAAQRREVDAARALHDNWNTAGGNVPGSIEVGVLTAYRAARAENVKREKEGGA